MTDMKSDDQYNIVAGDLLFYSFIAKSLHALLHSMLFLSFSVKFSIIQVRNENINAKKNAFSKIGFLVSHSKLVLFQNIC